MSNPPQNFGEVDSHHLKCTLVQKSKDSFFIEAKDFISNNEVRTYLNVEMWIYSSIQNLKINGELASSKYLISAWWLVTDLIGIFNADNRKTVSKLKTLKYCKEGKHIMVMTIAVIYIIFILCDIWLAVENYFQKILRLPLKRIHSSLFTNPSP